MNVELIILTRDLTDAIGRVKNTFNVDHEDPRVEIVTPVNTALLDDPANAGKPFLVSGPSVPSLETMAWTRNMVKITVREAGALLKAPVKPGAWE